MISTQLYSQASIPDGKNHQSALDANIINPNLTSEQIIELALATAERPVISTNFRPGAIALLHMVIQQLPTIPVIWVDTGFNTAATYRYVERLKIHFGLNLKVYTPRVEFKLNHQGGSAFPAPSDPEFKPFVELVKLEPFRRAFKELRPDVWLTGIRSDQTEYRRGLSVVSDGPNESHKVAPILSWTTSEVDRYIAVHGLPQEFDYFDPTKPEAHLECGLQLVS